MKIKWTEINPMYMAVGLGITFSRVNKLEIPVIKRVFSTVTF